MYGVCVVCVAWVVCGVWFVGVCGVWCVRARACARCECTCGVHVSVRVFWTVNTTMTARCRVIQHENFLCTDQQRCISAYCVIFNIT